jgi:hypothetical protein
MVLKCIAIEETLVPTYLDPTVFIYCYFLEGRRKKSTRL